MNVSELRSGRSGAERRGERAEDESVFTELGLQESVQGAGEGRVVGFWVNGLRNDTICLTRCLILA